MTKKSLSDLLREEAQESPTSPADESTPTASTQEPGNAATDIELSQLQSQLSQAQARVDTLNAALQQEKSQGEDLKKQLSDRQKADQKQLKALEAAQKTIKTLENSLKQEQNKVKALQKDLEVIEQLQAELETEKGLIEKLYSKILDLENSLAETPAPDSPAPLALRPPAMPMRYIAPEQPPSQLTDEDIGWFD